MAWEACELPSRGGRADSVPAVTLNINKGGKRVMINREAAKGSGLVGGDLVTMEREGNRFRIRREKPGGNVYGILGKGPSGSLTFSTGGGILVAAGFGAGRVSAVCFDGPIGAVVFDATPLTPKVDLDGL